MGIDFSMSSPAMVVLDSRAPLAFEESEVRYMTSVRKAAGQHGNMHGVFHGTYLSDEHRYDAITENFTQHLTQDDRVLIEDYAFAAKGRVFHIGECTGLLKHKLWKAGINFDVATPGQIKKIGCGRGNASKQEMMQAFTEQTGIDLKSVLKLTEKQDNPASDIVDAWAACRLAALRSGKVS